jgi:hypothetical protein
VASDQCQLTTHPSVEAGAAATMHRQNYGQVARQFPTRTSKPVFAVDQSAVLRDGMLGELATIDSAEGMALWAKRNLPVKNNLTADDARRVEEAFQAKIAPLATEGAIGDADQGGPIAAPSPTGHQLAGEPVSASVAALAAQEGALLIRKPRRLRDKKHRDFVSAQACLVCGRQPSDPHHLRFAQAKALGRKVSDEFTVPLCRVHHRELHQRPDEGAWWNGFNLDPMKVARALWLQTHESGIPAERASLPNGAT